jgi:hypothetical protein
VGKTSPFITSTQGLIVYCPDARPARATFAFTQTLNRAQIPPPPHRLEVALHADRQAVLQGEILRMLGEHRSEEAIERDSACRFIKPLRIACVGW